jgi:hypothetical protein
MKVRYAAITHAVLAFGVALRLGLALATPAERAYDDHYPPVRIILTQHRLPDASDCWECYQPPLYYLVSAGLTAAWQKLTGASDLEKTARRVLQLVSTAAGCATLYVCWLAYRRFGGPRQLEALALAPVALLPAHIHMSAMATNDAFTHFVASCAIYAALRAGTANWTSRACLLAGALAGATVLSKAYGWVTVVAIVLAAACATRRARTVSTSRLRAWLFRPALITLAAALGVGLWPGLRNLRTYGSFHVDNFELRDSPMRFQPPGSVRRICFFSFRLGDLLGNPWLHMSHVDSFWTELYGRMWFDYEGFNTTLAAYRPWQELWRRCAQKYPLWEQARWEMLLSYQRDEVPPAYRPIAVTSYLAGLPITLAILAGLALGVWRSTGDWRYLLVVAHLALALAVPLVQTLRLPHFAAMKVAFALSGISSAPALLGPLADAPRRALRLGLCGLLWVSLAAVACAQVAFVWLQFHVTWDPRS